MGNELSRSLSVPVIGVSVFDAIEYGFPGQELRIALPISRNDIAIFHHPASDDPAMTEVVDISGLKRVIEVSGDDPFLLHGSLFGKIAETPLSNLINIGTELASYIARYAATGVNSSLSPIYVQHPAKQGSLF